MKHLSQIQFLADRFLSVQKSDDLFPFLETSIEGFKEIVQSKKYHEFYVEVKITPLVSIEFGRR